MDNKDIKKITYEVSNEGKRYIGILKEDFDSKVQLIAEQYASIKETLDLHTRILESHSQTLESHSQILNFHSQILESHTKTLESHTKTLDSHTEMIAGMKEDIEIMKVDVQFIKGSLKQKVDVEEFEALARRVAILEAKMKKTKTRK